MPDCTKVVVIGAGGHADAVMDVLWQQPQFDIVGCIDKATDQRQLTVPRLGDDADLPALHQQGIHHAVVAIGNNQVRQRLARAAVAYNYELIRVISSFGYVAASASIAPGVVVMPGAVVGAGATILANAIVNTNASVDHECVVGESCHIAPGCTIAGRAVIEEGVFVGAGATVIDGVSIGAWTTVGAGAVVTRDLPANCVAVGVPARVIRYHQAGKELD